MTENLQYAFCAACAAPFPPLRVSAASGNGFDTKLIADKPGAANAVSKPFVVKKGSI